MSLITFLKIESVAILTPYVCSLMTAQVLSGSLSSP